MSALLPLEEAQARLIAQASPLAEERVPLAAASGRYLARPACARLAVPPADVSAMDGWAVRVADLPGPWRTVGLSAAGRPWPGRLGPGEAVRIFTGAAVPPGADAVLLQEEAVEEAGLVRLAGPGPDRPGRHIRRAGQDAASGAALAPAGARLTPARIGLLAAAGLDAVCVRRRPRVALLATGSELVPPGTVPGPGQIVSANGVMLAALAASEGANVRDLGIVPDDAAAIARALAASAEEADVLVTIGGASVGAHDLVRPAVCAAGGEIAFWRIAVRPGKPLLAGRLGGAVLLGLPGNPVSSFVCALLFLLPLVRHLAGADEPLPRLESARAAVPLPAGGPRRDFQRARLEWRAGEPWVVPARVQDSAMLSVLAGADALLVRPEHAPPAAAGTPVPVLRLWAA